MRKKGHLTLRDMRKNGTAQSLAVILTCVGILGCPLHLQAQGQEAEFNQQNSDSSSLESGHLSIPVGYQNIPRLPAPQALSPQKRTACQLGIEAGRQMALDQAENTRQTCDDIFHPSFDVLSLVPSDIPEPDNLFLVCKANAYHVTLQNSLLETVHGCSAQTDRQRRTQMQQEYDLCYQEATGALSHLAESGSFVFGFSHFGYSNTESQSIFVPGHQNTWNSAVTQLTDITKRTPDRQFHPALRVACGFAIGDAATDKSPQDLFSESK